MSKVQHDSEVLAKGQQVFSAVAFIHREVDGVAKLFMAKRAATKKFLPNVYELPGGHIDFGEAMTVGLTREIREEFGMRVTLGDPFFVFTYDNPIKQSQTIEVIYFARFIDPLEQITYNPEDHSTFGWFAEDELHLTYTAEKGIDDIEAVGIRRGFELLRGGKLDFLGESDEVITASQT